MYIMHTINILLRISRILRTIDEAIQRRYFQEGDEIIVPVFVD